MALTDNAVCFYDLDADVLDDSGNGKDGTNNGVTFSGGVGNFDGSSDITLPSSLLSSNVFTVTLWLNPVDVGSYHALFSYYTSDGNSVELFTAPSGGGLVGNFGSGYFVANGTFATSTLYHIVLSSNGTTGKAYVNGSLVGSAGTAFSTFTPNAYIGSRAGSFKFSGTMQGVGLFSDAKDATWVTAVYNSGTPLTWAQMAGGGGAFNPYYYRHLSGGGSM